MTAQDSYLAGPRTAALAHLVRDYGFGQAAAGELLDLARARRDAFQRSAGGVLLHVHYARGSRAYGIHEESPAQAGRCRNTAEPSGELSVGDVVAVGEVALAVGRPAGWDPVRGGMAEVRTDEHGTHPLPARAPPAMGQRPADARKKEQCGD